MTAASRIRRRLEPSDLAAIIDAHERIYGAEYSLNDEFVEKVASAVARAARSGFPSERERIWIVELNGVFAGSTALTDEGNGTAMLRWVVLDPAVRGLGLGRTMIAEAVEAARQLGYERIRLETFSELRKAAEIYRDLGFEVIKVERGPRWGRAEITYQTYVCDFARPAESAAA